MIPTLNRVSKLTNCVRSIEQHKENYNIKVHIYFSDKKEMNSFPVKKDWIEIHYVENYIVPDFWNSHLLNMKADALFYINDDVELLEDTIDRINLNMDFFFKDFDGIIGVKQINLPQDQCVKTAFGVIGKKFADRFPNRQVFCPDYKRFYADLELGMFTDKIKRFQYCEDCKILHHHPAFDKTLIDSTHVSARKYLSTDRQMFIKRQSSNLLWGETYEKILNSSTNKK